MAADTRKTTALAAITLASVLVSCGDGDRRTVRGDGSSTVFLIAEAVAEELLRAAPDTRVTIGVSGTGGGFTRFCAGESDFQSASRPIKPSEIALCAAAERPWIELPVANDGIVVVVHPDNTFVDHLTRDELKRLWEPAAQGVIKTWSQLRPGWPERPIRLFGAGVDSGTYDYFTEAIVGKAHQSRGDYTSSEDDNVIVRGVAADPDAIGYFGYAYFEENQRALRAVPIDGGHGPVAPTVESIADGTYFPLSRPLFLYVGARSLDRPEVAAFVDFYLRHAATLSREVGYVPLPADVYALVRDRVARRQPGSLFQASGSQVGASLRDLLSGASQ